MEKEKTEKEPKENPNSSSEIKSILDSAPSRDVNFMTLRFAFHARDIYKKYHDGFISKKDIEERKFFMTAFHEHKNRMVAMLGLLEKVDDPEAKAQISVLKENLARVYAIKSKLEAKTPDDQKARVIHEKQLAKIKENAKKTAEAGAEFITGGSFSNINGGTVPNASETLFGVFILAGLKNAKFSAEYLAKLAKKPTVSPAEAFAEFERVARTAIGDGISKEELRGMFISIHKSLNALRANGFSDEEINAIMSMKPENLQDAQKIEEMFVRHNLESPHIHEDLGAQNRGSYLGTLMSNIHRYDVMHNNAYDYCIVNPQQKIAEKTPEEIIAHQASLLRNKGAHMFSRILSEKVNTQA